MKINRFRAKARMTSKLTVETLEPRRLLTQIVEGVDSDGDVYQIKLSGAGTIASADLNALVTAATSSGSTLTVEVTNPQGDGLVNVGSLDTSMLNLGRVTIEGDLGAINIQRINLLQVESLGAAEGTTRDFQFNMDVGKIIVNNGITDAQISVQGNLAQLKVGRKDNIAGNISNTEITITGDLDNLQALQSITAGSALTVGGAVKNMNIGKSIIDSTLTVTGAVQNMAVNGSVSRNSEIHVTGNVNSLQIRKDVSDVTMTVDGVLKNLSVSGDFTNSTLEANGLDRFLVGDNLNDCRMKLNRFLVGDNLDDCRMNIMADLLDFRAGDVSGLTLRVGGSIKSVQVAPDFQNGLISVLNDITNVKIGQDLDRTTIMAGIDIGSDYTLGTADDGEWGNLDIGSVTIGGDMIDSSIAAGVKTSADNTDPWYGNGDDVRAYKDGAAGTAHINKISVKGEIYSTLMPGEFYAITADDGIASIRSAGKEFSGVPGVVKQEF
jgi:hypothetical protein